METGKLIGKGLIIGLGKIIPGVSGSLLAVTLGVYEKSISIISNPFNNFKENIFFLGKLGLGIVISIIIGSRVISYLLVHNYFTTMLLFIGLIVGTIPNISKNINILKKTEYFYFLIPIILMILMEKAATFPEYSPSSSIIDYIITVCLGFLDALTMVVPGISGTAIFMLIGCYNFLLFIFGNIFSSYAIFFGIGVVFGIYIVSKIMNYFFQKYHTKVYLIIFGLSISSIWILIQKTFSTTFSILELICGIFLSVIGYLLARKFG